MFYYTHVIKHAVIVKMSLTAAPRIGSIAVALVDASRLAIATLISALHAHALAIEILVSHALEVIIIDFD